MMSDFKNTVDKELESFRVDSSMKQKILDNIKADSKKSRSFNGKIAAVVLAAVIAVLAAFPCAATVSPGVNDLVFKISPSIASRLYPINKSCVSNGIELTVLYAANDKHSAVVYFSLRDIDNGGKVLEDADVLDSYILKGGGDMIASCTTFEKYDEKTGTAYFSIQSNGYRNLTDRMTVFSVGRVMSGKRVKDFYNTGIPLESLADKEAETVKTRVIGIDDIVAEDSGEKDSAQLLPADKTDIPIPTADGVTISNAGFANGRLHIQTKWDRSYDNHGYLYLVKKGADAVTEETAVTPGTAWFRTDEDSLFCHDGQFAKHIEYIFDIGKDELKEYELWAEYTLDGVVTEGDWSVNFRFGSAESIDIENPLDKNAVSFAQLSELGFYAKNPADGELVLTVEFCDGTGFELRPRITTSSSVYYMFGEPVDLEDVASVSLGGKEIYKKAL